MFPAGPGPRPILRSEAEQDPEQEKRGETGATVREQRESKEGLWFHRTVIPLTRRCRLPGLWRRAASLHGVAGPGALAQLRAAAFALLQWIQRPTLATITAKGRTKRQRTGPLHSVTHIASPG